MKDANAKTDSMSTPSPAISSQLHRIIFGGERNSNFDEVIAALYEQSVRAPIYGSRTGDSLHLYSDNSIENAFKACAKVFENRVMAIGRPIETLDLCERLYFSINMHRKIRSVFDRKLKKQISNPADRPELGIG
ncbi:hypothetical protein [Marinobacter orientalis]|uniref:Uncharacterized protein n=1 Tax=Marinobacter orientalis TaxID=1928859 RepID=A0A7Y0RC23_9GAMM|nr:hypothetical protein [Marinobacter orientalis]NMT63467.1 hypothetical protein [Marinobacter orientalis]TGX48528.1 hypothetical protein DIT72_14135 [Marinobacter orientalis]